MNLLRFDVFGKMVGIERTKNGWAAYILGNEGRRQPAKFVVPDFIQEEALSQYLGDLFHESATKERADVKRIE